MKQRLDSRLVYTMALVAGGAFLLPSVSRAQQSDQHRPPVAAESTHRTSHDAKDADIPAASRPPKGMCRIWLNDVPASQQPAATDCATAVRNRPQNGRVIFGDDYSRVKPDSTHRATPAEKGFREMKKPLPVFRKPPA